MIRTGAARDCNPNTRTCPGAAPTPNLPQGTAAPGRKGNRFVDTKMDPTQIGNSSAWRSYPRERRPYEISANPPRGWSARERRTDPSIAANLTRRSLTRRFGRSQGIVAPRQCPSPRYRIAALPMQKLIIAFELMQLLADGSLWAEGIEMGREPPEYARISEALWVGAEPYLGGTRRHPRIGKTHVDFTCSTLRYRAGLDDMIQINSVRFQHRA
jgi:hypothetical protein